MERHQVELDRLTGAELLRRTIQALPVPGAPPGYGGIGPFPHEGGEVGLAFLESSLRLHHIRRLTERVRIHGVAEITRSTELDVGLSLVSPRLRRASRIYGKIRARSPLTDHPSEFDTQTLWVPVTRIPSFAAPPLQIRAGDGLIVPRLTRRETARVVAPGLYRLLKTLLSATPHDPGDRRIGDLLHVVDESRWHIEASLYTLMTERGVPALSMVPRPANYVAGPGAEYKEFALRVLDENADLLRPFYELLAMAVYEQPVVVGLSGSATDVLLQFDEPLQHAASKSSAWRRIVEGRGSTCRVKYLSRVPETVNSYHLAVEVEDRLVVDPMILTTKAEELSAQSLIRDLRGIAERREQLVPPPPTSPGWKHLELEGQTVLRHLAEMWRRRQWEAEESGHKVADARLEAVAALSNAATDGLSSRSGNGEKRASVLVKPEVTSVRLRKAAAEIEDAELSISFSQAMGPPSSSAHCYWRRPHSASTSSQPVSVRAQFVIRNPEQDRTNVVVGYVVGIAALIWVLAMLLARGLWPVVPIVDRPAQADAVVAVLLLVPGYLYGHLQWPTSGSIAARLRSVTHAIAGVSLGVAVILAACVAANLEAPLLNAAIGIGLCVQLVSIALVPLSSRVDSRASDIGEAFPPRWVKATPPDTADVDLVINP